ncbi:MAG: class I SAM-dependent methyltransferase [bacterium]
MSRQSLENIPVSDTVQLTARIGEIKGGAAVMVSHEDHVIEYFDSLQTIEIFRAIRRAHPGYLRLIEDFGKLAQGHCEDSRVFEPGCATGAMASMVTLLGRYPVMEYVGIDPANGAQYRSLRIPDEFRLVKQKFLEWSEPDLFDVALSRFTVHHFPDKLDHWYGHIARHLIPNGRYLHMDHVFPEDGETVRDALHELALAVPIGESQNAADRDAWIRHFLYDWSLFLPVSTHLEAMARSGLRGSIAGQYRDQVIIEAVKY